MHFPGFRSIATQTPILHRLTAEDVGGWCQACLNRMTLWFQGRWCALLEFCLRLQFLTELGIFYAQPH